jgi:hypothetical protein
MEHWNITADLLPILLLNGRLHALPTYCGVKIIGFKMISSELKVKRALFFWKFLKIL